MARWKLLAPHYLNTTDENKTMWEYKEVDRGTGKQVRKQFDVPRHLNPFDPSDWNYQLGRDDGEIIVSDGVDPGPKDIIFKGNPTPDMMPVDDAARKISAGFVEVWKHPIENVSVPFSQSLVDKFQAEMAAVQTTQKAQPVEGMTELLTAMTQMMKQNQEMIAALTLGARETPAPAARRA